MSAVADKLREARALIEPQGAWTQRKFRTWRSDDSCAYCADGALLAVISFQDADYPAMIDALKRAAGAREHAHIWAWNDAPERTQAEVLAAFDKAILLAEREAEDATL